MKKIIMTYGLPGSGKSTLAKSIKQHQLSNNKTCVIFETDDFFVGPDGTYRFVQDQCHTAHRWTFKNVEKAMIDNVDTIIISNTNLVWKDIKPYVHLARMHGYFTLLVEPDVGWSENLEVLYQKNIHQVPMETLQRMHKSKQEIGYLREKIKQAYEEKFEW